MTKIYQKNQPESIQKMFGSIAEQYDKTNALLSFNLHRYWNRKLIQTVQNAHPQVDQYLDLCCGTGEIAYAFLKKSRNRIEAFLLDFCEEMLKCARSKQQNSRDRIHFIQGDAQEIPLPSKSVDAVTIAYGIRNVKDPQKCVNDVFRVLRPGGVFAILELTQPTSPLMSFGHRMYLRAVLPIIGKLTASNKEAYEYLSNSIQAFIPPEDLQKLLIETGFEKTRKLSLTGGIATIVSGIKC
ncbi:bifunctional demethylmenaquinone methyltransferase/2-methoxy-6-polyprenyl-1,4-benzoquinol methylase UbiE [Waddlia chondrophila]|uniref:Demethylmenaquinone methyltransferase n=1 Tax=Waddlia chondrophila (strain ATCC VR-1470 / WSU 86-1044) TaxID=716544 RepID=D6YW81_WADCW|nr:bifunctional demethylmenaquinone methyltransferase/2-methoxy-6-polyprenyl-1,4-benzoquinol methylase UbiE [Waddlia chondrophila]ADI38392.1 ubiquinone/menaquinone biosynthesis methyltransferase [Waddlia chondrophila WSU 86-1044]